MVYRDGKAHGTIVYNIQGVFEICRWSRRPIADRVMDELYNMAEEVMINDYFSTLSDYDLLRKLVLKYRENGTEPTGNILSDKRIRRDIRESRCFDTDCLIMRASEYTSRALFIDDYNAIWGDDKAGANANYKRLLKAAIHIPLDG